MRWYLVIFGVLIIGSSMGNPVTSKTKLLMQQADSAYLELDFIGAIATLKLAEKYTNQHNLFYSQFICLNNLGALYIEMGKYEHALNALLRAISIRENIKGEPQLLAKCYQLLGKVLTLRHKNKEAISYLGQALTIYNNSSDSAEVANTYLLIGNYYSLLDVFDSAKTYLFKSLNLMQNIYNAPHPDLARCNFHIGEYYFRAGEDDKILDYYQRALKIRLQLYQSEHPDLAESYESMGYYYQAFGDYAKSLLYYQQSANIRQHVFGFSHPELGSSYMNIGYSYQQLAQYNEAINAHTRAQKLWDSLNNGNHPNYSLCLRGTGECYEGLGKLEEARSFFYRGMKKHMEQVGEHHLNTSFSYRDIGDFYYRNSNFDSADYYYKKTLAIHKKEYGNKLTVGGVYYRIAQNNLKLGRLQEAMQNFQEALTCSSYNFRSNSIFDNPTATQCKQANFSLKVLAGKANAMQEFYDSISDIKYLQTALKTYILCAEIIDQIRLSYSKEAKGTFNEASMQLFEQAINTASQLYKINVNKQYLKLAFQFMEQSKAFMLVQTLKENHAKLTGGVPDSMIAKEVTLRITIDNYKKKVFEHQATASNKEQLKEAQQQLFNSKSELEEHIQFLERRYPNYYRLKYSNGAIDLEETQRRLKPNMAIYEYFMGDEQAYLFQIKANSFQLFELGSANKIRKHTRELIRFANKQSVINNINLNKFYKQSHELYRILFPANPTSKIIIVPAGILSHLAFDLLITKTSKAKLKQQPFLLQNSSISYAYSIEALYNTHSTGKWRKECLALAPSYKMKAPTLMASRGSLGLLRDQNLVDLPGAQQEVRSISAYFDGEFLFGDEANEGNFKDLSSTYQIIHIAAHAQADDTEPLNSKMSLAKSNGEDGKLHSYEVYNMNIPAELVVLSACETGDGKLLRGEGVLSLARSFIYAGSGSIVQTHWKTDDQASASIMAHFYSYLANGLGKSEALTQAKRAFLAGSYDRTSHPYYWASFALVGDPGPLTKARDLSWLYILLFINALGVGVLAFTIKY